MKSAAKLDWILGAAVVLAGAAGTTDAQAAGFYIQEQSAAGVGRAQAGNDVVADDASTVYFNPAGLSELSGPEITSGLDLIVPSAELKDTGSNNRSLGAFLVNPAGGGFTPASGGPSQNPGSATVIPNFSAALPITDSLTVGFAVTSPFGFASKYPSDWFGRYDSIDSYVESFDLQPTIAWKINEHVSIGIGLDEQYVYVKLRNALPNPLALGGPSPATDGRLTLSGHDWETGFNVGVLLKPNADTKFGLTYRYGMQHNLSGAVTFSGLSGPLAALNGQLTGAAALNLPDIITGGVSYRLTPQLTLLGEFDYYTWSDFKEIRIHLPPQIGDLVTPENYQDTWSMAVAVEYQLTDPLKLRAGFKFDQTPTVDAFRDTRVPDGDRYWISIGANYKVTDQLALDFGYAHIFVDNETVNVTRSFYTSLPLPITTTSTVSGQSEVSLDILSAGFTYRF